MIRLGDLADIVSGYNIARLSEEEQELKYTNADFDHDFYRMKTAMTTNAIIYRQSNSGDNMAATIISNENQNKFISQVFSVIKVDSRLLHPYYLCYLLNESEIINKQCSLLLQGSVITRLSAQQLKQIKIPLKPMSRQEEIGEFYVKVLYQRYLETKKVELKFQAFRGVLHNLEMEKIKLKSEGLRKILRDQMMDKKEI
ncbi:MAG: restriction endonuclease subunit S [Veillonella sp.]|uniref:restriction endonuclease subunit S n=1 Tax=Veillonella sp. TaxID=1926307 RepID=UPI0025F0A317|nr:restriction endonuclease subunit S [Veillonella sp.]MBS4913366.1 restriction endonuclease subunit S [Veillonella sp.]